MSLAYHEETKGIFHPVDIYSIHSNPHLWAKKRDPNDNDDGQTPLHLASKFGQQSVVGLLLELGASIDCTDDYGQKPIHLAAQSNKPEVVQVFLKQRPNLVSVSTKVKHICWSDR